MHWRFSHLCIAMTASCFFGFPPAYCQNSPTATQGAVINSPSLVDAQGIVAKAASHATASSWSGPTSGPPAQPGKVIAFLAEDLRNGGILGVAQGMREAARIIGWTIRIFDRGGSSSGRTQMLADVLASNPDGLVLGGFDANPKDLAPFAKRGVPIVGWHVGPKPGPIPGTPIAMNVTTDPLEVARVTALAAVTQSGGKAGVIIFTDSKFSIAMVKANAMADIVRACKECALLEVRDLAISEADKKMPAVTKDLLVQYGKRWTHALAINDIYFDYATPIIAKFGLPRNQLSLLSAGDGSASAFLRIRANTYQTATLAEPLNLHGWQVVDELNRLFAHQPVSGYVVPVHLVTSENVAFDGAKNFQYDPDNNYRHVYRQIWRR
jgi:ribose transport system substrate-binding protein